MERLFLPDGRCALFRMWITSLKISGGPIENAQGPNINYKKTIKTLKCKNKKADRKNRKYISCQLLVCIQLLEIMYKYRKCILCEIIV